jgi:hypothetical protein
MRALVYVIALTAASVAAPAYAMHPGARPGEAFTFKFSLGPIEGGRARMSVGKPAARHGRHVIAVHGQAETTAFVKVLARIEDDYTLVFDTGNLLPVTVAETERGVRERRINVAHLDGRTADVDYWSPEKQQKRRRLLPRIVRDPLSGFFALRALTLADGQKIDLDVLDGAALWRVAMTAHRNLRVRLDSDGQSHAAIRIDGIAHRIEDNGRPRPGVAPRNMTIWLSDDDDRVLLRMEAETDLGRCALELTSYVPPTARAANERTPDLPGIETR